MKAPRAEKPDKRQRIIDAAVELFRKTHDVRKVTIEDIAGAARVSPTTVYNQFGNRDALVIEVSKSLIYAILENARTFLRSDLPFPAKLTGMISGKLELAANFNSEVVTRLITQDAKIAPFLEQVYGTEVNGLWLEMLEDGKRQGYIEESLSPEAFLAYMDVMRIGFSAKGDLFKDWQNRMDLVEELTRLFFFGFLKKDVDLFGKKETKRY
ncbi:MAG: TetR/AcrR family transcriptional regulator [Dehalogenimonas sp.]|jgi:AcrR family transcriptional regulator|uniref:TetR/AcrR family transcriptional regulator n=1 Tax=Candidatus Dehalogenimonas loeffleri TaxID=3127115 RepID=A0ABZ2JAU8_9CHLR|nr:TetR/AcrR family transcriptional regulator [Dehalogenimonas sp.]